MKGLAAIWPIIALAFPLLELFGIVWIWQSLGYWTLVWLLLAVVAGVTLIALERVAFLPGLAASVLAGQHPLETLKASGLRFLAGLLLILPGAISDGIAILLLVASGFSPVPPPGRRPPGPGAANDDVIEGEFRRLD